MILFVFEGKKAEPGIFLTLEHLFFAKKLDKVICIFDTNIYNLYLEMEKYQFEQEVSSVLKERFKGKSEDPFKDLEALSDISETYLFFDYDCQHVDEKLPFEELNRRINIMLDFFNEETEHGKLFINYPMVESIRYTKKLPDANYYTYEIALEQLFNKEHKYKHFKIQTSEFSYYKNMDFISFRYNQNKKYVNIPDKQRIEEVRHNWNLLISQNIAKANYILTGKNNLDVNGGLILQKDLFDGQKSKYIEQRQAVAIINSFPLFLYDYFDKYLLKMIQEDFV